MLVCFVHVFFLPALIDLSLCSTVTISMKFFSFLRVFLLIFSLHKSGKVVLFSDLFSTFVPKILQ